MDNKTVITIGRQFGSGGREIGIRLAKKLDIPFYDKEIISLTAEKMNMDKEDVEIHDEKSPGSIISFGSLFSFYDRPVPDKIFFAQKEIIREISEKPCVIVGRCADYILKGHKNILSVFISASLSERAKRKKEIMKNFSEENLLDYLRQTDKKRAIYYGYYTENIWGIAETYDLCLDSGKFGIDGCVDLIISAIEAKKI